MKKITTYIEDGGVTLDLWDPLVLTHESELFVKTAAVFWNYKNIRAGYNDYISVDRKRHHRRPSRRYSQWFATHHGQL